VSNSNNFNDILCIDYGPDTHAINNYCLNPDLDLELKSELISIDDKEYALVSKKQNNS